MKGNSQPKVAGEGRQKSAKSGQYMDGKQICPLFPYKTVLLTEPV